MARRIIDIGRRQVLRGAAGFTLALPFLPSLVERSAHAGDPIYAKKPRLVWFGTDHGGAYEASMFPDQSTLTDKLDVFTDHQARSGALKARLVGTTASVSPILSGKSSALTDKLVAKMNVLYGLDVPFYISHNTGLHLGNYARNDGNGGDGIAAQSTPRPTIESDHGVVALVLRRREHHQTARHGHFVGAHPLVGIF